MTKHKPVISPKPESHLEMIDALGLRTVTYLSEARDVESTFGPRREWLPKNMVGKDGLTLILYCEADRQYNFAGWHPEHDGMFGGRYTDILSALAWLKRARDVRAGLASDFRGV